MQRGTGNAARDKMDRDEKKRREDSPAPPQKLQLIKPFVVLIVIIGLAIFTSTYFVHPEFKVSSFVHIAQDVDLILVPVRAAHCDRLFSPWDSLPKTESNHQLSR